MAVMPCSFRKYYLCVIFLLVLRICSFSDEQNVRYTADVFHLPFSADIASMGDAGVVLPRRASSVIWNPASVAFHQDIEICAEIADLYQGLSRQASFALRVPIQSQIGVSVMYIPFFSGDIPFYDSLGGSYQERLENMDMRSDGIPKGYFRNNQHLALLTIGRLFALKMPVKPVSGFPLPLDISAGISLKGYWQTMNPKGEKYIGAGVNADIGVTARFGLDYSLTKKETSRSILLGITVRDLLPGEIIWVHSPQQYSEKMQYSHYYGISYVDRSGDLGGNWTVALALEKYYSTTYHIGIEAEFWNAVMFRAGLSDKVPTIGAGVHFKRYFLDYAFRFDKIEFSFLRLNLGVKF